MTIKFRNYQPPDDYNNISEFLIAHYKPGNADGNWIEPAWEYMHFHPALDSLNMEKFGMWEKDGEIIAVCHYEWHLGEAFFQFHPGYRHMQTEMLDYAERQLTGISQKDGQKYLHAFVNDIDPELQALVQSRGYEKDPGRTRPMYQFVIPEPFPDIALPDGFRLTSLAEDCDWAKVNRVIWRGFNHGDDVPVSDEDLESRRKMIDTPKARRDLKIAVKAPNGDIVAFSGTFYEPTGKFAYVEPVATDPLYRRLGLGKAAVLEGIRRCGVLGATVAYVGSDQDFYQALGFRYVYNTECWVKTFDNPTS